MGLTPLIVETLDDAVKELQHGFFALVIFDGTSANVDALEFARTVRNADATVPIVISASITGNCPDEALRALGRVHRTHPPETSEQAAKVLENILEGKRPQERSESHAQNDG
jgi:DNA-binding NtrC family response regulator